MKYLVKVIYEEETIDVNGTDMIVKTGNVLDYVIKGSTDAMALPRGGEHIFINGVDTKFPTVVINQESGELEIIENENAKNLKSAYESMDTDIKKESALKIGTANIESLFAFVDAFQLRMMIPERYASLGLKVDIEIGDFLVGDNLDTADKVKSYYTEILFYLDIHRLGKISEYIQTKAALGF